MSRTLVLVAALAWAAPLVAQVPPGSDVPSCNPHGPVRGTLRMVYNLTLAFANNSVTAGLMFKSEVAAQLSQEVQDDTDHPEIEFVDAEEQTPQFILNTIIYNSSDLYTVHIDVFGLGYTNRLFAIEAIDNGSWDAQKQAVHRFYTFLKYGWHC